MMRKADSEYSINFARYLALLFLITGGLFALYSLIFAPQPYLNFEAGTFLDRIPVPFDLVSFGSISFPIQVDNFLVFQEYHASVSNTDFLGSWVFGAFCGLVSVSVLALLSKFQKIPFLIGAALWIALLTLSNFNGLNIAGPSSNVSLIILISASLLPTVFFHIWGENWSLLTRWLIILVSIGLGAYLLSIFSPINNPSLYIAEHLLLIGLGMSISWVFWVGHGIISGTYILLARANRNLSMRISIQISIITALYFLILIFILLDLKGDANIPFPTFSPLYLLIPMGVLGWFGIHEKSLQIPNLAASAPVLRALYFLGFGMSLWLVWKLKISGNQPAEELFKHLIVYSQLGFSLFFLIYLVSNFLSVMDSGKAVDSIVFKPNSLPYYHLRIGGLMAMLVIMVYMDGIVGVQANSLTTNILADYYFKTDQKLEASILYENAWDRYRKNPKAKFLTAQLLFQLNQPSLAKEHLEQSFAEAPQVENILLLVDRLNRENKLFESVYYLENGLKRFPGNTYLVNNLALQYTLIGKGKEGLKLLEQNVTNEPVLIANQTALQTKLGLKTKEEAPKSTPDLINQINRVAWIKSKGELPEKAQLERLEKLLQIEKSPMLLQAGLRNLFAQKDLSDPETDLHFLDSLSQREEMAEYLMQIQETASIRSLGAGRVAEAIKNLNGLAFRNPGDAAYFLHLNSAIFAQNLDFKKSSTDLIAAEERGFKAFQSFHLAILMLGGREEKALEMQEKFGLSLPAAFTGSDLSELEFLKLLARLNQSFPEELYEKWKTIQTEKYRNELAFRILAGKSHGLTKSQILQLGHSLEEDVETSDQLKIFTQNPDWQNPNSLTAFTRFVGLEEELTANPYFTPLILSAAERVQDPLRQYEVLNGASEFNRDPLLWIRKVQAARRIGMDNYATSALQEMTGWLTWDEIEKLQYLNY
jgi:hypothetical protein